MNVGHGQTAGDLGPDHEPVRVAPAVDGDPLRERYGATAFGDDCLRPPASSSRARASSP